MPALVRCSVCLNPRAREIDSWLKDAVGRGQPRAKTSAKFGVSMEALARHLRNGHWRSDDQWAAMVRATSAAAAAIAAPAPDPLAVDGIGSLETLLRDLNARDTSKYTPRDLNIHNDQLRRTAEALARHKPPADREGPAAEQLKALTQMLEVYDAVIDMHPEIREELADALHAWKASR